MVVVGDFPQDEFIRNVRGLESRLNREINFTVYSVKEFEKERKKEGSFLNQILNEKKIFIKGEW